MLVADLVAVFAAEVCAALFLLHALADNAMAATQVEQDLQTKVGAKTLTFDHKTNHIITMAAEYGPAPAPPAAGAPQGRPNRGPMLSDSFSILVVGK